MVQRVSTVAFEGIEARSVDVQVQVALACPPLQLWGRLTPTISVSELIIEWTKHPKSGAGWGQGTRLMHSRGQHVLICD
jgi:hypothetical protein